MQYFKSGNLSEVPGLATILLGRSGSNTLQDIPAEVVFGSPKHRCAGHGICMVNVYPQGGHIKAHKRNKCASLVGQVALVNEELLLCKIRQEQIRPCLRKRYFSKESFMLDESFSVCLPQEKSVLCRIDTGAHILDHRADEWHIFFRIKRNIC